MKGKTLRNLFSLVLALTLILCMGTTAFAANVSITNPNGNEYKAWQIMTAEKKGTDNSGNDIWVYTVNADFADFFGEGKAFQLSPNNEIVYKNGEAVVEVTDDGRTTNTNTTKAAELAAALEKYAISKNISPAATFNSSTAATLANGYYVIAETKSASATEGTVASKPILLNVKDDDSITITPKDDTITLDKVIVEDNTEKKANDVSIGDPINYKVTTTIPNYEANVDENTLKFTLKDTFSDGLTYDESSLEVKIGGEAAASSAYTASYANGVLTVDFTKDAIKANQGKAVVLTYSAKLNENAKVDSTAGNDNTIQLTYSHNPNENGEYKTLEDKVITYTYGFKIHKTDTNDATKALADAEFELKAGSNNVWFTFDKATNTYTVTSSDTQGAVKVIKTTETAPYPTIKGLDEGSYTLTETKAPAGYATLADPITVTIEAVKDNAGKPTGIAKFSVSGGNASVALEKDDAESCEAPTEGTTVTEDGDSKVDAHVEIKNLKGISLPETGAKTALYCMIGGALIALFGCVFFFGGKRKKEVK